MFWAFHLLYFTGVICSLCHFSERAASQITYMNGSGDSRKVNNFLISNPVCCCGNRLLGIFCDGQNN